MEGVGARLGRSSSRYGTTTVFNGPVRKWKKNWVHVTPSSNHHNSAASTHQSSIANGASGGSNPSHLVFYKWTPLSRSNRENENNNIDNAETKREDVGLSDPATEEPPRRKFKYIPVALLEEQRKENDNNSEDDEPKLADNSDAASGEESTQKSDDVNQKPDINDLPMEEDQDGDQSSDEKETRAVSERQDLNVSTLDLSLGWTSQEGELDTKEDKDEQTERAD